MLKNILIPAGHEYESVTNGKDGLKLIQEQTWDVVLLDVAMPDFSGKDVVNELVKTGDINKQPVILFTASSISSDEVNEVIKQGVRFCLRKPMNIKDLLEVLSNVKK